MAVHWLGRHDDGFATRQNGGRGGVVGIAGAEVAGLEDELAVQQILGVLGREPASVFGDADGHHVVLLFIDCVEDRGGREQ